MTQNIMKPLGHGITVLDAHYIQPGIASIYLLAHESKVCVIETGTALSVPYIFESLEQLGYTPEDIEYVIPTHIHLDHAGGAGELIEQCSNARLVIHPRGAAHMIDPAKLEAGTMAVYGEEKYRALYGQLKPIPEEKVIIADDNFELDFHGRKLTFIDTPGHALHHFCVYDSLSQGIFTGDTYGLSYPELSTGDERFIFATTTPVHFDPDAMKDSIQRLMSLNPKLMYLTHYGAIEASEQMVEQLFASINAFVEIAYQAKNAGSAQVENIQEGIMEWLMARLKARNCPYSEEESRKLLRGDSNLNAQGLSVWLKRLEKLKQA